MSACAVEVLKVDCAIVGLLESKNQMGSLGRKNCIKVQRFEGMKVQRYALQVFSPVFAQCSSFCSVTFCDGYCGDQAVMILSIVTLS